MELNTTPIRTRQLPHCPLLGKGENCSQMHIDLNKHALCTKGPVLWLYFALFDFYLSMFDLLNK